MRRRRRPRRRPAPAAALALPAAAPAEPPAAADAAPAGLTIIGESGMFESEVIDAESGVDGAVPTDGASGAAAAPSRKESHVESDAAAAAPEEVEAAPAEAEERHEKEVPTVDACSQPSASTSAGPSSRKAMSAPSAAAVPGARSHTCCKYWESLATRSRLSDAECRTALGIGKRGSSASAANICAWKSRKAE